MDNSPTLTCGSALDAAMLRRQADALLQRLIADRESCEQRLAASGKRDPLKAVTGVTAIERAIASTRQMIAEMDLLLSDMNNGLTHLESSADESAASARTPTVPRTRSGGMLISKRPVAAPA